MKPKNGYKKPPSISERGAASESRRPKIVRSFSRTNEKNIKPHYLNARTFFFLPDLFRKYHSSCRTIPKNFLSKSIPRPPQLYHPGFKIDHIPKFANFQTPPAPGKLSNPDPGRDPIKCFRAAFSGNILGQNNSAQKLRPKTQHRA